MSNDRQQIIIETFAEKIESLQNEINDLKIKHRDELQKQKDETIMMWSFFYEYFINSSNFSVNEIDTLFSYIMRKSENSLYVDTAKLLGKTFTELLIDEERDGEYQSETARKFLKMFDKRNIIKD